MKTDFDICKQISQTTNSQLNSKLSGYFCEESVHKFEFCLYFTKLSTGLTSYGLLVWTMDFRLGNDGRNPAETPMRIFLVVHRLCQPERNIAIEHRFQGAEKVQARFSAYMELNYQTLLWKLHESEVNLSP